MVNSEGLREVCPRLHEKKKAAFETDSLYPTSTIYLLCYSDSEGIDRLNFTMLEEKI